ncbi:hypothetical protein KIN20_023990 [Parelaphostrongylus tenuis]|uniref:Uncharacterized protein n=1 Tax=Parelaphostrongylus tenuis TaxID=148309 RepID=A0AAD5MSV6_PARTN|nr:hypothetical protein KIN20_023990 [Parelaphostrongylus tenuis]
MPKCNIFLPRGQYLLNLSTGQKQMGRVLHSNISMGIMSCTGWLITIISHNDRTNEHEFTEDVWICNLVYCNSCKLSMPANECAAGKRHLCLSSHCETNVSLFMLRTI